MSKSTTQQTTNMKQSKYFLNHENMIKKSICNICLGSYTYKNKYHHNNTKRHILFLEKIKQKCINNLN